MKGDILVVIINDTKITYQDFLYMFGKNKNTLAMLSRRLLLIIAGLYMLVEGMNLIQKNMKFFVYIEAGGPIDIKGILFIALIVLVFLLGIIFIIFSFNYLKLAVYISYKRTYSKWSPRHMEFNDNSLEVSFDENGISSNTVINYDAIDAYYRHNNAIYIAVKTDGKKAKKYICVHDDAYKAGSAEELIKLLEEVL